MQALPGTLSCGCCDCRYGHDRWALRTRLTCSIRLRISAGTHMRTENVAAFEKNCFFQMCIRDSAPGQLLCGSGFVTGTTAQIPLWESSYRSLSFLFLTCPVGWVYRSFRVSPSISRRRQERNRTVCKVPRPVASHWPYDIWPDWHTISQSWK